MDQNIEIDGTKQTRRTAKREFSSYLQKEVLYSLNYLLSELKSNRVTGELKTLTRDPIKGRIIGIPSNMRNVTFTIALDQGKRVIYDISKEFVDIGIKNNIESMKNVIENNGNGNIEKSNKCNYRNCDINENLATTPCLVCSKEVHHICANEIYEGELHKRYCSHVCYHMDNHCESESKNSESMESINNTTSITNINVNIDILDSEYEEDDYEEVPDVFMDGYEESKYPLRKLNDEIEIVNNAICKGDPNEIVKLIQNLDWNFNGKVEHDALDIMRNNPKITCEAIHLSETPVDVFLNIFPEHLFCLIADESNRYREQNHLTKIKKIGTDEIIKFVALLISRSLNPWSSGMRNHWREKCYGIAINFMFPLLIYLFSFVGPFLPGTFGDYLSRNRYKEIVRCLHFVNNEEEKESKSKFFKVEPIVKTLNATFLKCYSLGAHVSYDECTIESLSRYCPGIQYNPMKPHPWGIKLHSVNCAETGYCHKFEVFSGKYNKDGSINENVSGPQSLLRNIEYLAYSKRIIYTDRFYTSLPILMKLRSIGLHGVGTIRTDAKGLPMGIIMKKNSKIERGTSRVATTSIGKYGTISVMSWMDVKPVHLISSCINTNANVVERRGKGKSTKDKIPSLTPFAQYVKYMGGTDLHDYLRMSRYSIRSSHIFKKWYIMFFCSMVDLAIVNSYILWKFMHQPNTKEYLSHESFMERVATGLLTIHTKTTTRTSKNFTPSKMMETNINSEHVIVRYEPGDGYGGTEKRFRRCFVCQAHGHRVHSQYYCSVCKVCVCTKLCTKSFFCWSELHSNEIFQQRLQKRKTKLNNQQITTPTNVIPTEPTSRSKRDKRSRLRSMKQTAKRNCNKKLLSEFNI